MKTLRLIPDSEEAYCDFPAMKYYRTEDNRMYFDALFYLKSNDTTGKRTVDEFQACFGYQINAIQESIGIAKDDIAILDEGTGRTMIYEALEFLFIAYVDSWYSKYVYDRLRELHSLGFTVSDPYLNGMYQSRFVNES